MSVTDYLFHSRHQYQDIRDRLRAEEDRVLQAASQANASDASRAIAADIKRSRFALLWNTLRDERVSSDASEELKLRCVVELLPEILVRHVGLDSLLARAAGPQQEFVSFMDAASRGIPCTADLLSA